MPDDVRAERPALEALNRAYVITIGLIEVAKTEPETPFSRVVLQRVRAIRDSIAEAERDAAPASPAPASDDSRQQLCEVAVALGYPVEMADAPCHAVAHHAKMTQDALVALQRQHEALRGLLDAKYLNPECAERGCQWLRVASPAPASGWQPIATAPKDGTEVLLTDGHYKRTGYWARRIGCWSVDTVVVLSSPTHWMPLPAPPGQASPAPRVKGDDGRWHEAGCPYVADDESDQVLADYGECVCDAQASPAPADEEVADKVGRHIGRALRERTQPVAALADERPPSAWSEFGDSHDYSRTGKHDPNNCRECLRILLKGQASPISADERARVELCKALEKARTFIEYARYELQDGKAELGDQFPRKADADEAIARINAALLRGRGEGP